MPANPRTLENHARRLADRFFREQDIYLVRKLQELGRRQGQREALSRVSGITNVRVLDRLLELGVGPDVLASLGLVPLIQVAWADGRVTEKARTAVFEAAEAWHLGTDSSHDLLDRWLSRPPDPDLLQAWVLYVEGLCEQMDRGEREALRTELLERARRVAVATGGFLGLTSPVSHAEHRMIATLEEAFARTTCGEDDGGARVSDPESPVAQRDGRAVK